MYGERPAYGRASLSLAFAHRPLSSGSFRRYFDERTAYEELQAPAHLSQHSSPFLLHPGAQPRWPSPAYSQLRGNVLPRFLSFSDSDSAPFPPPSDNEPFPTLAETHDYLVSFAKPLRKAIRCDTEVKEVCEREDGTWDVVLREWAHGKGGRETVERWDAVVIATACESLRSTRNCNPQCADPSLAFWEYFAASQGTIHRITLPHQA